MSRSVLKLDLTDAGLAKLIDELAADHYVQAGCTECGFYRKAIAVSEALQKRSENTQNSGHDV